MPVDSKTPNNKFRSIGVAVAIFGATVYGLYFVFNAKFIPPPIRSSIRLYDPNHEMVERQTELKNAGFFGNGVEQGSLDATCTSWMCSYDLTLGIKRGTIIPPTRRLKIGGYGTLTRDGKKYYDAGYIKGYEKNCARYHADCESRVQKMKADYARFFEGPMVDVGEENSIMVARDVQTRVDGAVAYYKIDNGEFTLIDTDALLKNTHLPVRENAVGRAFVSLDKKYIVLEVSHNPQGDLSYLVFEIDTKQVHTVNIPPFPFEYVSVIWTPDHFLVIEKYGDTPQGRGVVEKYVSTDTQKPWAVIKRM